MQKKLDLLLKEKSELESDFERVLEEKAILKEEMENFQINETEK